MRSLVALLLILFSFSVQAQIRETKDGQIVASVDDRMSGCYFFQEQSNWCWAAALQMVLAFHKVSLSQRTLVKRAFQKVENRAASITEMVSSIDGFHKGKKVISCTSMAIRNMQDLIGEISEGYPVVVGMEYGGRQHAMVLVQILFQKDGQHEGKINPAEVVLLDPSRRYLRTRKFSFPEFSREINMALQVRVKEETDK